MLHRVERERGTINKSVWELRDKGVARRISTVKGSHMCTGGCAAARVGWEVIVDVTVHEEMSNLT